MLFEKAELLRFHYGTFQGCLSGISDAKTNFVSYRNATPASTMNSAMCRTVDPGVAEDLVVSFFRFWIHAFTRTPGRRLL